MKRIKNSTSILFTLTLIVVFSLAFSVVVKAANSTSTAARMNQGNTTSTEAQENVTSTPAQGNTTSTEARGNATSTPPQENRGQITAQSHRSVAANFVHSLLQVADREGGIGEQVRVVARLQNQSATTTIAVMEMVEKRNKIETFLFGSDYKNLGALRSEVVQTRNRLEQLNRLMENAEDQADKIEIQNQSQVLEQEQTRIENFIKAQESKFSLFGWLIKLLNR